MLRCERDDLLRRLVKTTIADDQQSSQGARREIREALVDIAACTALEENQLPAQARGCHSHRWISRSEFGIVRIRQALPIFVAWARSHAVAPSALPLSSLKKVDTRDVSSRPVEAGHKTRSDGISPEGEDDRDRRRRLLSGERRDRGAGDDHDQPARRTKSAANSGSRS